MLSVRPEPDLRIVEAILCDPTIWNKIAHDGRICQAIEHPAVTYYAALVDDETVGIFTAVRFSRWEVEVHAAILPHAIRYGRDLARLFLNQVFADSDVMRATAYVLGTLPSAANWCRKLGFVDEGKRADACLVSDIPTAVIILGLTRATYMTFGETGAKRA